MCPVCPFLPCKILPFLFILSLESWGEGGHVTVICK